MEKIIDLDVLDGLAKAAGDQPWQQGRMLATAETQRWTEQQKQACGHRESQMVFQGFTAVDQGCSRQRVALFEAAEHAAFVAEANPVAVRALIAELKAQRQALDEAQAEITALSKNVIDMTREDFDATLNNLRRMGASIDGDNAYKRDLLDCAVGAMAFGSQGNNRPPAGHWGQRFWDIGRGEAEAREELIAALKLNRENLRACQATIHLCGGFDPAYVNDAQAAMKVADEALAKFSI